MITTSGHGESFVGGTASDAITGRPIAGVTLEIIDGGNVVGSANSDAEGIYRVQFGTQSNAPHTLTLRGVHQDYVTVSVHVQIQSGGAIKPIYNLNFLSNSLSACLSQAANTVVVGHFRSPLNRDFSELPGRIAETLDFNLTTRLQTVDLPANSLPAFEACEGAKPKALRFGKNVAKALRADALVHGNVFEQQSSFAVSTYVSYAYEVFERPNVTTNPAVDLNNPAGAAMSKETHAAILAAVAAGIARRGDCLTAISVIAAAESLVGTDVSYLVTLRKQCEAELPNINLLRDDG